MQSHKCRIASATLDELYQCASAQYWVELEKPKQERHSARDICKSIGTAHKALTGNKFHLAHTTLLCHVMGGRTCTELHEEQRATLPQEDEQLVAYSIEQGDRCFPLSYRHI